MFLRPVTLAAVATALSAAACSSVFPDPVVGAQTVLVLTYNPTTSAFAYTQQSITTLHDLRTMQGAAASVFANATVAINYTSILAANPPSAAQLLVAGAPNSGQAVDFDYFMVKTNGVNTIYPGDFDSLNIASTYYNVEQAYLFFEQFNVQLAAPVPVYYFPTYSASPPPAPDVTDLGVSDPALGFLVVPPFTAANVPPAMQPGVVAYQYAQAVFQQQVFPGGGLPWLDSSYAGEPMQYQTAMNVDRSIRDGLSDFLAAVIVSDPAFVHTTGTTVDPNRQLNPTMPRCMTAALASAITSTPRATYDAHPVGSILAALLWNTEVTEVMSQAQFNASVVAALQWYGMQLDSVKSQMTLAGALDAIATKISPTVQNEVCSLMLDRFSLTAADLPDCPANLSPPEVSCAQ